ncbi:uncharacterized protein [Euphorbia lathyris]|uniref:uncharacterized protein n=1 Tax=Euphorbia lathyris TaxID=212925 RepID=UPI00331411DD
MGTKIEYAINLLASEQKSSNFSVHSKDESDYYSQSQGLNHSFQITGLHKMPEKPNIDFIRNTMQIHEDIFKQQVRELHRVYSVQKMLMEELEKNKKHWNYRKINNMNMDNELSSRERSGSCSGVGRGFDLERVAAEDVSTGVSINEGDNAHDEDQIELTLSLGGSRSSKKQKLKNEELQESSRAPNSNSSPANIDKERKHPHWLFQGVKH